MSSYERALTYIKQFIKSLLPAAEIKISDKKTLIYELQINSQGNLFTLPFDEDLIDDFNQAINNYKGSDDYNRLENYIEFQILIFLGENGLITNFPISKKILDEKVDAKKELSITVKQNPELHPILYQGLKKLFNFLSNLTQQHNITSPEIKKELTDMTNIINYYDARHTFGSSGVLAETLGYLKAAAVCIILDTENEKRSINEPRIRKIKDKTIYSIVKELRSPLFSGIKMPECIFDYAGQWEETVALPEEPFFFIACGQKTVKEKSLGKEIKKILKNYSVESFFAETVNNLDSLNSHIFENLTKCTSFIAILHKRDDSPYQTSVWINQEIAIISYLIWKTKKNIQCLVLYEEGAHVDGLIRYTIHNSLKFRTEKDALEKIEIWLRENQD